MKKSSHKHTIVNIIIIGVMLMIKVLHAKLTMIIDYTWLDYLRINNYFLNRHIL